MNKFKVNLKSDDPGYTVNYWLNMQLSIVSSPKKYKNLKLYFGFLWMKTVTASDTVYEAIFNLLIVIHSAGNQHEPAIATHLGLWVSCPMDVTLSKAAQLIYLLHPGIKEVADRQ